MLALKLTFLAHKYRHELRPRGGLLRTREFVMKDLYTFDFSPHAARKTYDEVKKVYCSFFDELKIPYVISEAGTGVMGGDVSHEFHYLTDSGEDVLFICDTCKYTANEEIVEKRPESYDSTEDAAITSEFSIFTGLSHDRRFLINAFYPKTNSSSYDDLHPRERIDIHALKKAAPSLDLSRRSPMQNWIGWMDEKEAQDQKHPYLSLPEIINVFDHRLSRNLPSRLRSSNWAVLPHSLRTAYATNAHVTDIKGYDTANNPINLQRAEDGDGCPRCAKGTLRSERAVEVGHNFHLGTRYSEPLGAYTVIPRALAKDVDPKRACRGPEIRVPLQMGCHGIGVSRLMAAIAVKRSTSDKNTNVVSLEWPRHVAPFDVAIIHGDGLNEPMTAAYDSLAGPAYGSASGSAHDGPLDVVIDDRPFSMSWKLGDAFAMGYPVVLILGTKWEKSGKCEVFCNALDNFKQEVSLGELNATVSSLLVRL